MTLAEAVVDASVVVRGLTTEATRLTFSTGSQSGATAGHAPDLLVAELANALALAVRTERGSLEDAQSLSELLAASPIELHSTARLAPAAIELAARRDLSAYDAFSGVLAAALEVPLVTADRRLAAAVPGAVRVV